MAAAPAGAEHVTTKCVRGAEYTRVRVDVRASEVTLLGELTKGGSSTVYRGLFGGSHVAVKKPKLATRADMDRYHKELQLLRRVLLLSLLSATPHSPLSHPVLTRAAAR
jgi:hypothetical protein